MEHTNEADVPSLCANVRFFDTHIFLNSLLHAIFGVFYSRFLVNVYASGTVILQGTGNISIEFYYNYFLSKCALFIHLRSAIPEISRVVRLVLLQWWKKWEVNYLREGSKMV